MNDPQEKAIRRWVARGMILLLALYLSIAAFAEHRDYLRLLGGICIAYVFAWLGGEVERNRKDEA